VQFFEKIRLFSGLSISGFSFTHLDPFLLTSSSIAPREI
jgi:hypothetical protein